MNWTILTHSRHPRLLRSQRTTLVPKLTSEARSDFTLHSLHDQLADASSAWHHPNVEGPQIDDLQSKRSSLLTTKIGMDRWSGKVNSYTQPRKATPPFNPTS
jgi:hypothetical protein